MDALTWFGLFAVSLMLAFYAAEDFSPWFVLAFAGACLLASAYGFLQGAWPFGAVEAVWAVIAMRRWRLRLRSKSEAAPITAGGLPGMSERVLLGRITGAHGLKGEVKIATFTAAPEDLATYGPLSSADGTRVFEIASLRGSGGAAVIARLLGVADRSSAESLCGTELFVARVVLPPASADEYYHSDLIGLTAISPDGETLGQIVAVQNYGAGDLLELRPVSGRQTELIPFEYAHVPKVDLEEGRLTIVKPVYVQAESTETE